MESFDEIYAAHYVNTVQFARNRCNLRDDTAEQIALDAFMDLHEALQKDTEIKNSEAWLHKRVLIRHVEHIRYGHRKKRGGEFAKHGLTANHPNLAIEHPEFEAVDAADTIQSIWHRLTEAEQKIAEMVFMQELNQRQIAVQLSVTLRTVERHVSRVRNRLRTLLLSPLP